MQDMFYAMTETEIARELGISKTAVKTILHRALEKIRKHPELCARFRDGKTGEVTLARIGGVVLPPSNYRFAHRTSGDDHFGEIHASERQGARVRLDQVPESSLCKRGFQALRSRRQTRAQCAALRVSK